MGYKWKPSALEKQAYALRMHELQAYVFVDARTGMIRTGDFLKFVSLNDGELSGVVIKHSYGSDRGQHTFTILLTDDSKKLVKGRNLYPRLLIHDITKKIC